MNSEYAEFLARKASFAPPSGLREVPDLFKIVPEVKRSQAAMTTWALRRGTAAIFAGTGLGKSLMQLLWSYIIANEAGNVLILCPLAVAEQTVAEASKFGIPGVAYASDQKSVTADITVTNYERFHLFDINRFAGIVLDECFATGTLIDTPLGVMPIEDIRPGMYIKNATGTDRVVAIAKREVFGAIKITVGSTNYVCSTNHPWLTELGWKAARDILASDRLIATKTAVRLVREGVPPEQHKSEGTAFLREILLRELADERAGNQSQSACTGSCREAWESEITMVARNAGGPSSRPKVDSFGAYTRSQSQSVASSTRDGTQTSCAWRQRSCDDRTTTIDDGIIGRRMGGGDGDITRPTDAWVSDSLQTGPRELCIPDRYRTGRSQPSEQKGFGYQEGYEVEFSRVESIEVLELGCTELDQFRDADGRLYFYDIEAERHPSFSVGGNLVHNSGIIKSHDGAIRKLLTDACRDVPWKLCCTATPSPNDYTELGQHAEFLGVMDAKEMLAMFFVHDGSIRANDATQGHDGWRMKRHAAADFWRWLASWSVMVRNPRDLGFDEPGYDLPPLNLHQVTVAAEYKPTAGELFPMMASTLSQRIGVRRDTADARVAKAVEIINREPTESWLVWCHLNKEADAIEKLLPACQQVAGKHPVETKVARLLGFKTGNPLILATKPSVASHGMNYQNCARVCFVGMTDSFENIYQAVRRSWRFGQTRPVEVYFIASELEGNVVANLKRKEAAFELMLDAMSVHMRDLMIENVIGGRNVSVVRQPEMKMELPPWIL